MGFTLSQAGMVMHHVRLKEPRWKASLVINAIGALTTGLIAGIVVVSKFAEGAWIPAALIPIMVFAFYSIGKHYKRVKTSLEIPEGYRAARHPHYVVVLVGKVNRGVVDAIGYARSLNPDRVIALSVVQDPEEERHLHDEWDRYDVPIDLHTVSSPYRELTRPVFNFLDEVERERPDDTITVVIPESVTKISSQWLHNQSALALKARLLYRPRTVVVSVPVHID